MCVKVHNSKGVTMKTFNALYKIDRTKRKAANNRLFKVKINKTDEALVILGWILVYGSIPFGLILKMFGL